MLNLGCRRVLNLVECLCSCVNGLGKRFSTAAKLKADWLVGEHFEGKTRIIFNTKHYTYVLSTGT